jgi:peptidoglycan/LPS O-acetylase OafA/YrhL
MVPKYTMFEVITIFLIIISIAINKYKANNFILEVANCSCLLFLPTSVMLICLFASNMGDLSRLSKNKILIYIGDLSPYGYMIHQMISICIVIVFTYILGTPLSIPVKSIMTAVITWMVICLYKKFETKVLIKEIS